MTDSHDIPIVDAHHHIWDLANHRYPWLDPDKSSIVGDTTAIRRTYGPAEYRSDTGAFNVVATVHLDGGFDPSDAVGETRMVHAAFEKHGFPNAIVASARLDASDLADTIDGHLRASHLFRGIRHIVAWHAIPRLSYVDRPDLLTDAAWVAGYRSLAAYGLSCDMQIYPSQMADAAQLAASTPDTAMIINQAGMPDGLVTGDFGVWRRGIRLMAQSPNVAFKISGFGMLRPDWTLADVRPLIEEAIEVFGADRVMFGSNFPVDKLFGDFARSFDAFIASTHALSHADRIKIFATNAIRIYRIDTSPHHSKS
jgi:predicted TIM-barrel fold metal-dependent hydrolase